MSLETKESEPIEMPTTETPNTETQTKNIEQKDEPAIVDSYEKKGSLYFHDESGSIILKLLNFLFENIILPP